MKPIEMSDRSTIEDMKEWLDKPMYKVKIDEGEITIEALFLYPYYKKGVIFLDSGSYPIEQLCDHEAMLRRVSELAKSIKREEVTE